MIELTKREKKVARQVIEKGLQVELEQGLTSANAVLKQWKEKKLDNRDAYHLLYQTIRDFDKHIAWRYDDMRGSKYLPVIIGQLEDKVISEEDLEGFSDLVKEKIKFILRD